MDVLDLNGLNHRPMCPHLTSLKKENHFVVVTPSCSRQSFKVQEPGQMNAAVGEIKKLNEQLSQLRQENIVLKVSLSSSVETIVGVLEGLFSSSSDFGRYKLLKENQT